MTLFLPSMQEWGAIFSVSQARVQASFASFVIAYGAMQLVFGPLSDRHGRKPVLLAGLAFMFVGSLLGSLAHAWASDFDTVIAARALQGAGAAAGSAAGRASIQDHFDGPARTRVMAYVGMVMGVCPPIAMVVGGSFHERLGWASNFVFAMVLVLLTSAAVARLPSAPPTPRQHARDGQDDHAEPLRPSWWSDAATSYVRLARHRGFLPLVLVMGFTSGAFYAFLGAAPLVLRGYGVGPASVGQYVMVVPLAYVVGNFLTSRLARRFDNRTLMVVGHAITLVGIVSMIGVALLGWRSPWSFAWPLALFGLGHGLSVPTVLTAAIGLVPSLAGAASALGGVAQQFVGAAGSAVVGWLDHDGGPVPLGLVMLGATLVSSCALALALSLGRRGVRSH